MMVYHGPWNGVTMYIDGSLASSTTNLWGPFNFSIGNGKMVPGRRETNVDKLYASFLMDELTLWTEEFSAEDVKDLYDAY